MHSTQIRKQFSFKDLIILFSAILFFVIAGTLHNRQQKPVLNLTKQDTSLNVNRNFLLFLNVGNKRLLADLLWIQTLLESDEAHYSKKDLNSWMYLRFLSIATLDPKFYENYLFGGMYLSIVKDDPLGASVIYDEGIKNYPKDYKLNFNSGFNYYYELEDLQKGLEILEKIQFDPMAPPFLSSLVNKLKYEVVKDPSVAMDFLKMTRAQARDQALLTKLDSEIYALQAEQDLACLNQSKANCNKLDSDGKPYAFENGKWKARIDFKPYRLKNKRE